MAKMRPCGMCWGRTLPGWTCPVCQGAGVIPDVKPADLPGAHDIVVQDNPESIAAVGSLPLAFLKERRQHALWVLLTEGGKACWEVHDVVAKHESVSAVLRGLFKDGLTVRKGSRPRPGGSGRPEAVNWAAPIVRSAYGFPPDPNLVGARTFADEMRGPATVFHVPEQPKPPKPEPPPVTKVWKCAVCGGPPASPVSVSFDPTYGIARCKTCGKRKTAFRLV